MRLDVSGVFEVPGMMTVSDVSDVFDVFDVLDAVIYGTFDVFDVFDDRLCLMTFPVCL